MDKLLPTAKAHVEVEEKAPSFIEWVGSGNDCVEKTFNSYLNVYKNTFL